ncbi:unnamed protein product [Psylliodes chrysocephalus]|uniref:Uncharacterized protein n=1 Tax=Psylliodes chrysocephalus TaxID=3402493 RepID=A0A9P0CU27_9CUCU|nr:unnamed protein product [Psylliodes chrysocephala]
MQKINSMLWLCDVCLDEVHNNGGLRYEIESLKQSVSVEIGKLKEMFPTQYENNSQNLNHPKNLKSYAQAAGEVVIIKPKNTDQACSKKTFEAIQKYLNPTSLQIGINKIRKVKDSGVVIKCNFKNKIEKVKSAVEKKLSKSYNIVSLHLKNPSIKVADIGNEMSPKDLINCIKKQNGFLNDDDSNISLLEFFKKSSLNSWL